MSLYTLLKLKISYFFRRFLFHFDVVGMVLSFKLLLDHSKVYLICQLEQSIVFFKKREKSLYRYFRIRLDLVKHLMIKISERSFTLRYVLSPCTVYIKLSIYFILFSLENDDMESSKRSVKLLSLIFIIDIFVAVNTSLCSHCSFRRHCLLLSMRTIKNHFVFDNFFSRGSQWDGGLPLR